MQTYDRKEQIQAQLDKSLDNFSSEYIKIINPEIIHRQYHRKSSLLFFSSNPNQFKYNDQQDQTRIHHKNTKLKYSNNLQSIKISQKNNSPIKLPSKERILNLNRYNIIVRQKIKSKPKILRNRCHNLFSQVQLRKLSTIDNSLSKQRVVIQKSSELIDLIKKKSKRINYKYPRKDSFCFSSSEANLTENSFQLKAKLQKYISVERQIIKNDINISHLSSEMFIQFGKNKKTFN